MDKTVQAKPKKTVKRRPKIAATGVILSNALNGKAEILHGSRQNGTDELRSLQILATQMAFEEGDFKPLNQAELQTDISAMREKP